MVKKHEEPKDLGFGIKSGGNTSRRLNKDGTFNVFRRGAPFFQSFEIYHTLISMSWMKFSIMVLSIYAGINLLFACFYMMAGVENFTGISASDSDFYANCAIGLYGLPKVQRFIYWQARDRVFGLSSA